MLAELKESKQLGRVAAVPGAEEEEDRYPLLGYLVYWSMVDVRITPEDLHQLFSSCGVDEKYFPPKIREPDAFRRATSAVSELSKGKPHTLEDGTTLTLLVREVRSDASEIIMRLIGEVRDSANKKLGYHEFADVTFSFQARDISIDQRTYTPGSKQVSDIVVEACLQVQNRYADFLKHYTGKHIREMTRKAIQTTSPVNMRSNSGAGGLWFVPIDSQEIVLSFERLIKQLSSYRAASGEAIFDSIPLLDIEKQRALIFSKYESQVEEKVDSTMTEIKCLLDANKSVRPGVAKKYLGQIKELKLGIGKYEGLLERNMEISREKTRILEEQVQALLERAGGESDS